ncbi:MAG: hypothetical protein J6I68_00185 [Butyrivibrio sp.]|uniref:hypothetical protein n=1 Tax=Butyrivibrio sp. TaxID=28121 RepID=UPI001B5A6829|nr:hypothetical protein [Butyrivibrio sp.]MBP3781646.1 hypothetical protein [Butyrivibrio sp.]
MLQNFIFIPIDIILEKLHNRGIERVMEMWSKELQILDRNTVKYMIDELQEQLDDANATIADKDATIADKDATIAELQKKLSKYES